MAWMEANNPAVTAKTNTENLPAQWKVIDLQYFSSMCVMGRRAEIQNSIWWSNSPAMLLDTYRLTRETLGTRLSSGQVRKGKTVDSVGCCNDQILSVVQLVGNRPIADKSAKTSVLNDGSRTSVERDQVRGRVAGEEKIACSCKNTGTAAGPRPLMVPSNRCRFCSRLPAATPETILRDHCQLSLRASCCCRICSRRYTHRRQGRRIVRSSD